MSLVRMPYRQAESSLFFIGGSYWLLVFSKIGGLDYIEKDVFPLPEDVG